MHRRQFSSAAALLATGAVPLASLAQTVEFAAYPA